MKKLWMFGLLLFMLPVIFGQSVSENMTDLKKWTEEFMGALSSDSWEEKLQDYYHEDISKFIESHKEFRKAYAEYTPKPLHIFVDGDDIMVKVNISVYHVGKLENDGFDVEPRGNFITWTEIWHFTVKDGKVDEWKGLILDSFGRMNSQGIWYTELQYTKPSLVPAMMEVINTKGVRAAIELYENEVITNQGEYPEYVLDLLRVERTLKYRGLTAEQNEIAKYIQNNHPPKKVTFELNSDIIPADSKVYITGNHPDLNYWNPGSTMLTNTGNGTWRKTFTLNQSTHLEYKFTLGSWKNEAIYSESDLMPNLVLDVKSDTTVTINVQNWTGL